MKKLFAILLFIILPWWLTGQSAKKVVKQIGESPIYFIDSIKVDVNIMLSYSPDQIASISIFRGKSAIDLAGEEAKDGIIYIETKDFARLRFWKYFRSKSKEYFNLVTSHKPNDSIQYILNEKILVTDFEGDLSMINDKIFKGLQIIDKSTLVEKYNINDKAYGVLIFSSVPENLRKAKKKF